MDIIIKSNDIKSVLNKNDGHWLINDDQYERYLGKKGQNAYGLKERLQRNFPDGVYMLRNLFAGNILDVLPTYVNVRKLPKGFVNEIFDELFEFNELIKFKLDSKFKCTVVTEYANPTTKCFRLYDKYLLEYDTLLNTRIAYLKLDSSKNIIHEFKDIQLEVPDECLLDSMETRKYFMEHNL